MRLTVTIPVVIIAFVIANLGAAHAQVSPFDKISLAGDLDRAVADKLTDFGIRVGGANPSGDIVFAQDDGGKIVVNFTTGKLTVSDPNGQVSYAGEITFDLSNPLRIDWTGVVNNAPASGFLVTDNEPDSILVQAVLDGMAYRFRWVLSSSEPGVVACKDITSLRTVRSLWGQLFEVGIVLREERRQKDGIVVRLNDGSSVAANLRTGAFTFVNPQGASAHTGNIQLDISNDARIHFEGNMDGEGVSGFVVPMNTEGLMMYQVLMGAEYQRGVLRLGGIDKNGDPLITVVATVKSRHKLK